MFKKLSLGVISLSLSLVPLAASAQTTDVQAQISGLTAQLQQLLQQIAQLQGSTATPSLVGTASCPSPLPTLNLSVGSMGLEVVALQGFLIARGYLASGKTTGFYGSLTEAGVQQFQSAQGIVSSGTPDTTGYGVVGPRTRAMILQVCNPAPVSTPAPVQSTVPVPTPQLATITSFYANPSQITAGQQVVLNWNVQNAVGCVLSEQIPGQTTYVINANAPTSGSVVVVPTNSMLYTIACTSVGAQGQGAVQSVTVSVIGSPATPTNSVTPPLVVANPSLSVSVPSTIAPDNNLAITWNATSSPSDAAVRLELIDKITDTNLGTMKSELSTSGSTSWRVPLATDACNTGDVCGSSINTSHAFAVQAELYSPSTAYVTTQSPFFSITPGSAISASIDPSSLNSSTTRPFIRGVAYNTPAVSVTVSNGSGVAYNSGQVPVTNSLWQVVTSWLATSTSYNVFVYSPANVLLANGTLNVGSGLPWGAIAISTDTIIYGHGVPITVTWNNQGNVSATDWIAYVPETGSWNVGNWTGATARVYTNGSRTGSATVTAPTADGRYQIAYYTGNSFTELGRSGVFTIVTQQ